MLKKLYISLVILLVLGSVGALYAQSVPAPYAPWFAKFIGTFHLADAKSLQKGVFAKGVARFVYNVPQDGGTVGDHSLGTYLPASAIITRTYFKVITPFTDAGGGVVGLKCETANNIYSGQQISGAAANALVEGKSTGTMALAQAITNRCQVTATVSAATQTAGKLVGFVEYVMGN